MADTSGNAPKRFRVQKDNGEWWTMTFGGGRKGVRWDRENPTVHHETAYESYRYAEPTPGDRQRAKEWSDYVAERLIQRLEEYIDDAFERARPHIEEWLIETALPWLTMTAKSTWTRLTAKKQSTQAVQFETPAEARITDVAPTNAIVLSERTDEHAPAHSALTPEEARKQLEDIALLTKILAAKVRTLTTAVIKENGESDERFLERRQQAEQLAVRHVASNIQVMLEQGTDLGQALALSATYTPAFAAGRVETGPLSIESRSQLQQKPLGH
jgi:hypothetical protein